jgi:hypothetical protein
MLATRDAAPIALAKAESFEHGRISDPDGNCARFIVSLLHDAFA